MGAKQKIKKYQETEDLNQTDTPSQPAGEGESSVAPEQADGIGEDEPTEAPVADSDAATELERKLAAAEKEAGDSQDRFLRLAAEFENFKKRAARDKEDMRKFATEALLKELLPVVDNLERAIQSSDGNDQAKGVAEGVRMTLDELLKAMERFKVEQLDSMHRPFDPAFHQAVAQKESESHPDNTVIEEFQKGYTLHGRLLRPAMVVVSKAPAASDGKPE